MKAVTIKNSGVLWRLATFYGPLYSWHVEEYGTDICKFTAAVLTGLRNLAVMLAGAAVLTFCAGDFLGWIVAMLVSGSIIPPDEPAFIFAVLLSVGLFFAAIFCIFHLARHVSAKLSQRKIQHYKEPNTVQKMFYSWKNKYCIEVKVEQNNAT